eukprot:gene25115-31530_t
MFNFLFGKLGNSDNSVKNGGSGAKTSTDLAKSGVYEETEVLVPVMAANDDEDEENGHKRKEYDSCDDDESKLLHNKNKTNGSNKKTRSGEVQSTSATPTNKATKLSFLSLIAPRKADVPIFVPAATPPVTASVSSSAMPHDNRRATLADPAMTLTSYQQSLYDSDGLRSASSASSTTTDCHAIAEKKVEEVVPRHAAAIVFTTLSLATKKPRKKPLESSKTSSTRFHASLEIVQNVVDHPDEEVISALDYLSSCCEVPAQRKKLVDAFEVFNVVIEPHLSGDSNAPLLPYFVKLLNHLIQHQNTFTWVMRTEERLVEMLVKVAQYTSVEDSLFQCLWALRLISTSSVKQHVVSVLDANIFGALCEQMTPHIVDQDDNVLVQALHLTSLLIVEAKPRHYPGLTEWFKYVELLMSYLTAKDTVVMKGLIVFLHHMLCVQEGGGFQLVLESARVIPILVGMVETADAGEDGANLSADILFFFQKVLCNDIRNASPRQVADQLVDLGMLGTVLCALKRHDDLTGSAATKLVKSVLNYCSRLDGGSASEVVQALLNFQNSTIFIELNLLLTYAKPLSGLHLAARSCAEHILMRCVQHAAPEVVEQLLELFGLLPVYDILYYAVSDAEEEEKAVVEAEKEELLDLELIPAVSHSPIPSRDILAALECLEVVVELYASSSAQFNELKQVIELQRAPSRLKDVWTCVEILTKKAASAHLRRKAGEVNCAIEAAARGERLKRVRREKKLKASGGGGGDASSSGGRDTAITAEHGDIICEKATADRW